MTDSVTLKFENWLEFVVFQEVISLQWSLKTGFTAYVAAHMLYILCVPLTYQICLKILHFLIGMALWFAGCF